MSRDVRLDPLFAEAASVAICFNWVRILPICCMAPWATWSMAVPWFALLIAVWSTADFTPKLKEMA